jgi:hypothetical protein
MHLDDLPKPVGDKASTREIILNILSVKKGLTSKEISNIIKREFSKNVSYQAVHKELKELCEEKIILKENRRYTINSEWVEKISDYIDKFSKSQSETSSFRNEMEEKGVYTKHFSKSMEMGRFCIADFLALDAEGKDTVCFWRHLWPPIGFSDDEAEKLRELFAKNNYIMLGQFDTPMDIICKNFFEGAGAKVFLGIPLSFEVDIVVHGGYVGYFHFEMHGKKNWDMLCRLNKKFDKINLMNFLKPMSAMKYPIDVVVVKNPALAENIRTYAKEHIKKLG